MDCVPFKSLFAPTFLKIIANIAIIAIIANIANIAIIAKARCSQTHLSLHLSGLMIKLPHFLLNPICEFGLMTSVTQFRPGR